MEIKLHEIYENKLGMCFAVSEITNKGVRFWSISTGLELNGLYPPARLAALVEAGTLRATGEFFDVGAAEEPRIARDAAQRAEWERQRADAEVAGQRQIKHMLGEEGSDGKR